MARIVKIKNDTGSSGTWLGCVIAPGVYVELEEQDFMMWRNDASAQTSVINGDLVVNDGTSDFADPVEGWNWLVGPNVEAITISGAVTTTGTIDFIGENGVYVDTTEVGTVAVRGTSFGELYGYMNSEGTSTTSSTSWQDKVAATTPTASGTFRLGWHARVTPGSSNTVSVRLRNTTDGSTLSGPYDVVGDGTTQIPITGFRHLPLTGTAKTVKLQVKKLTGTGSVSIDQARLEFWQAAE